MMMDGHDIIYVDQEPGGDCVILVEGSCSLGTVGFQEVNMVTVSSNGRELTNNFC